MLTRRNLLKSGGPLLAGLISPTRIYAASSTHVIHMDSDLDGAKVWFDPIGLFVQPGDRIKWIIKNNVHTVTSYHPDNDNHSLRIPELAEPWNIDFLVNAGESFEITLSVPGVYDYYCEPHEEAGMVGRIIVGEVSGPGSLPFDYFERQIPTPKWETVPEEAQVAFPSSHKIMTEKRIRINQV
jgi:plastocyanin